MQKCLNNNDILVYSTTNKSKLVVAQRFLRNMKDKNYEKWQLMTVNLILVIRLSQQMSTKLLISVLWVKRDFIVIILLFIKNLNRFIKLLSLKLMIGSGLLSVRIFLAKFTLKNLYKKYLRLIVCWKLILWLKKEKIIENFAKKNCCWVNGK